MVNGRAPVTFALAAAMLLGPVLFQLVPDMSATSELFKSSAGDTTTQMRISTPPGYNDSLSFTLPSECSVQSAGFELQAEPVRIPASITDSGRSAFLNGSTLDGVAFSNGSLGLEDLDRAVQFTDWHGDIVCGTAASGGSLYLARDTGAMYFAPNERAAPSNQSEYDPAIAVGPDDSIYLAWADQRQYDLNLYFTRSTDRGATFSNATSVNDDTGPRMSVDENPDIAAGPGHRIYIVWTDHRNGDEDVYMAMSSDGGASFGPNLRVDDGPAMTNASLPSIAVLQSGKVAVAWQDDRTGDPDIRCAFSGDGTSFGPSVRVNTDNSRREQLRPRIAAGNTDLFHIVWTDNRSGSFKIYYARSGGSGFLPEVRVDDSGNATTRPALQAIAVGPQERVHVVWHDTRFDSYRVMYSSSQDGIVFTPNIFVSPVSGIGKDQYQPRIQVGPGGVLHVIWEDQRNGDSDIFYANSTTNGLSFNPFVRVDDAAIEQRSATPALAVDSLGEVHVAWWDNRTPGSVGFIYQVFYSRGENPYFSSGHFDSPVIDLGAVPSALVCATADIAAPGGTTVTVNITTAPGPSGPWSGPFSISTVGVTGGPPAARYIRWQVDLSTENQALSPSIASLRLDFWVHPVSGSFLSRPIVLPFPLRTADVLWTEGKSGDGPTALSVQVSADNGSHWQEARPGLPFEFSGTGRVLVYRVDLSGSSSSTPTLSYIFFDLQMESALSDVRVTAGRSATTVWSQPGPAPTGEATTIGALQDSFNRAIQDARRTLSGNATLRINISSSTPGIARVSGIKILYDLPPVVTSRDPTGEAALDEGDSLTFRVTATDPDNDPMSSRWLLDGTQVETNALGFIYLPDFTASGLHNLTVVVSDGLLTASVKWMVTVRDVNRPPAIQRSSPGDIVTLQAGGTQRFEVRSADPDGDQLIYAWSVSGTAAPSTDDFLDFTAPRTPGTYYIQLNISDGKDTVSKVWTAEVYKTPGMPGPTRAFPWVTAAAGVLLVLATLLAVLVILRRARPGRSKRRRGRGRKR